MTVPSVSWIFGLIITLLVTGCGQHEQELWRVDAVDPAKNIKESDPQKIIVAAIYRGDIRQIHESLNQGVDINSHSEEGLTLLMVSVKAQQFATIEFLLQQGADVEAKSRIKTITPQWSVLEFVANLQSDPKTKVPDDVHTVITGLLMGQEFPPSVLNDFIHSGIEDKNFQLVDWVLSRGADPNTLFMTGDNKDKPKFSPLIHVFSLEGVRDFEVDGKLVPHFTNLHKIFETLVSHHKIDLNLKVRRYTPLSRATKRADKEPKYEPWLNRLIELGAK